MAKMWGWAVLSFLLGAAACRAYNRAGINAAIGLGFLARARIALAASAFAALVLIVLAAAVDGAWLPKWGYCVYSTLVAPRFVTCFAGFVAGAIASRTPIIALIGRVPAWTLSGAVAVLLIAGVVFALNPALLNSLQSFKVAGVEATFASRGSSIREADIRLNDVAQKLTLEDYINFRDHFIKTDSARRRIAEWFLAPKPQQDRIDILDGIFGSYVNPIVLALRCTNEMDALDLAKRQDSLAKLAVAWEHFLLQLNKKTPTEDEARAFFERVEKLSGEFIDYAKEVGRGCSEPEKIALPDAMTLKSSREAIWAAYHKSMQAQSDPKTYALTAMEPYVAGLAGDLIAFTFGYKEKADFLEQIAADFPRVNDLLQPGIINLFFQIADAKVQSDVSWPLDKLTAQLDYALQGADAFIAVSQRQKQQSPADEKVADEVIRIYDVVVFRILTQNLAVYNQRTLRGEALSEADLRRWNALLSRLLAISHARSKTIGPVEDVKETALPSEEIKRWPSVTIEDRFLIDANIDIALSLVLYRPEEDQSSASACASARYYLKSSEKNLENLFKNQDVNLAEHDRLEQFIKLVGYRVGAHCAQRS